MKTKIIFVFFVLVSNIKVFAQFPISYKGIDSIFQKNIVSNDDWAIGLSIQQAGIITMRDSLGNVVDEPLLGTFLLFKIGSNYFVQKIWSDYSNDKNEPIISFGTRLKLNNEIDYRFTTDSIQLAKREWIYPYIYRNDSLGIFDQQLPADHEPYYVMYFKTAKNDSYIKSFTETNFTEKYSFLNSRNLNYNYNLKTFINRAFVMIVCLIRKNIKALAPTGTAILP